MALDVCSVAIVSECSDSCDQCHHGIHLGGWLLGLLVRFAISVHLSIVRSMHCLSIYKVIFERDHCD